MSPGHHGSSASDSNTVLGCSGCSILGLILLAIVLLLVVYTGCCKCILFSYAQAYTQNKNIREAGLPSGPPRVDVPMTFDPATRKARVLRALVEREVTLADMLRLQESSRCISSSIDSTHQLNLRKLSFMDGEKLYDLEAPPIKVEQVDPVTIDKYLRDLAVKVEVQTMQTLSTFNAENHSKVDGNILPSGECTICMEEYKNGDLVCWSQNLSCNHAFHTDCVLPWLTRHDICPNCRSVYLAPYREEE